MGTIYAFLIQLIEEQYPIVCGQKNMSKDKNNPPLEEEIPLDDLPEEDSPKILKFPEYYEESTDYSTFGSSGSSESGSSESSN